MNASASLIQVTLALMLMVGLILGLAWLTRRFAQPLFQQQKNLRLISSLSLGVKEKIILVEVNGKQLVLGVTPQQITSLHVMDAPSEKNEIESVNNESEALNKNEKFVASEKILVPEKTLASDFSKKLLEILKINQPTP
jgi:flagellar protein FliO/FliZ